MQLIKWLTWYAYAGAFTHNNLAALTIDEEQANRILKSTTG